MNPTWSTGTEVRVDGINAAAPIPSPCTQVCRIDEASGWCEGCGRTLAEIAAWGEMSEAQKASVWASLAARRRTEAAPRPAGYPNR